MLEQTTASPSNDGVPADRVGVSAAPACSVAQRVLHVVRGALPAVMTATLIPLALFYGVSAVADMKAGIVTSLAWAYLVLARQFYTSRRASGLLMITAFTLTVRCLTWSLHQTTFTYFSVPVAETVGIGTLFVATLAVGRPLLVSLARDFVPALGDRLTHGTHRRLVRHLSWVWALVYIGSAATSAMLLLTQDIHWFLLFHQASSWTWVAAGLVATFAYGRRHGKELLALATTGMSAFVEDPGRPAAL
ncbi:MAG: hypothetical protein M3063_11100 [Actinomycetota bacterium]|nr:hypothetical protein [Actinomycetota bacterium]